MITVRLSARSTDPPVVRLRAGATVKELIKAYQLEQLAVRLNRKPIRLTTELKDGDIVVAVPRFLVGSSTGRYDHLDLEAYRRTMSPADFRFFVNFVGADVLGFRDDDLEPC